MKINRTSWKIRKHTDSHKRKKKRLAATACLAAAAALCTICVMIRPAAALEAGQTLDCTYTLHQHDESCYGSDGEIICGYADYVIHTHDDYCYAEDGVTLLCQLEETELHTHDESCYTEQIVTICGYEASEGHVHDESCYGEDGVTTICGYEAGEGAHQHTEDCYASESVLSCGKNAAALHTHDESCYGEDGVTLICGQLQVEQHQHTDECLAGDESGLLMALDSGADSEPPASIKYGDYTIYRGSCDTSGDREVWTAYDGLGADDENATIQVTVTLPENVSVANENAYTYLYIVKISGENADYYPTADALKAAIGDEGNSSAVECYAIHWVTFTYNPESGEWECNPAVGSVLEEGTYAEVEITYLNDHYLAGAPASHALQVFNSRDVNGEKLESAVKLESIKVAKDLQGKSIGYAGFKFETDRGGPYVFVSKELKCNAYVSSINIKTITDGMAPFDSDNSAGNDSGNNNGIVRTFDTVMYTFDVTYYGDIYTEGTLGFEVTLEKSLTEAAFDMGGMTWIQSYQIQYLDADGKVILYQDGSTLYQVTESSACDAEGFYSGGTATSVNALASGSEEKTPYQYSAVKSQRLIGITPLDKGGSTVVPGTSNDLTCSIKVLNAKNEDTIKPELRLWLVGNEKNYGYAQAEEGSQEAELKTTVNNVVIPEEVTVSAAAQYNLEILANGYLSYKSWFDSSQGEEVTYCTYTIGGKEFTGEDMYDLLEALGTLKENQGKSSPSKYTAEELTDEDRDLLKGLNLSEFQEAFSSIYYGRMYGYGIDLQLASTDSSGSKGMKGISLPYGEISFDFLATVTATTTDSEIKDVKGACSEYYAILWDYTENTHPTSPTKFSYEDRDDINVPLLKDNVYLGNEGRNMYWDGVLRTTFSGETVPYNYGGKSPAASCAYNGGSWSAEDLDTTELEQDEINNGMSSSTLYSFSVSGYDFDLNNYHFPTTPANSTVVQSRYLKYEYPFSSGYVQVLSVMPRSDLGTIDLNMALTVGNLKATSISGQELPSSSGTDKVDYTNETNTYKNDTGSNDNVVKTSVTVYAPGSFVKYNGFNQRTNFTAIGSDSLASKYWGGKAYDASAFLGSELTITGSCWLSPQSDENVRSLNFLQLFDSYALSIDEDLGEGAAQKDKISLWIGGVLANSKDYVEGRGEIDVNCDLTFLYAADPKYSGGYNTNEDGVLQHMNEVVEEDLIYFESLAELEDAGYTCIGVLAEVRECNVQHGTAIMLRIPVKVNEEADDIAGQTVATVNSLRAWKDTSTVRDITWADGSWRKQALAGEQLTGDQNVLDGYEASTAADWVLHNNPSSPAYYVKAEYENGAVKAGTNAGGYLSGNSLLILNYYAQINISVDRNKYDLSNGAAEAAYTLSGISTTLGAGESSSTQTGKATDLTITVGLSGRNYEDENDFEADANMLKLLSSYQILSLPEDGEGEAEYVTLSTDPNNPTTVYFKDTEEKLQSFTIYAELSNDSQSVTFQLKDVPIGATLPDISFSAMLGSSLANNATVTATAKIYGPGDTREFTSENKNYSQVAVTVSKMGSTGLTKSVDPILMELDGSITYSIRYANSAANKIELAYFYDILPYDGDARRTDYNDTEYPDDTILTGLDIKSMVRGSDTEENKDFQAAVTIYYSSLPDEVLSDLLSGFNGELGETASKNKEAVEEMLTESFKVEWEDEEGTHEGTPFHVLGTMKKLESAEGTTAYYYREYAVDAGYAEYDDNGKITWLNYAEYREFLATINAIFVKVEGMGGERDIVLELTLKTQRNEAGDLYANKAWAWIPSGDTEPLPSDIVETRVIARSISGLVWYDADLDGVYDEMSEQLLSDVEATLFVKDGDTYQVCTTAITGKAIGSLQYYLYTDAEGNGIKCYLKEGTEEGTEDVYLDENGDEVKVDMVSGTLIEVGDGTVITGADGAYSFSKLAAGEYTVAFKGEALEKYNGATYYQINNENNETSNDGVALGETESGLDSQEITFNGIDEKTYSYAIAYSLTDAEKPESISMHSIPEILEKNITLTNSMEQYANQNLGVVICGYELPETGGEGSLRFLLAGLALLAAAAGGYGLKRRRTYIPR